MLTGKSSFAVVLLDVGLKVHYVTCVNNSDSELFVYELR